MTQLPVAMQQVFEPKPLPFLYQVQAYIRRNGGYWDILAVGTRSTASVTPPRLACVTSVPLVPSPPVRRRGTRCAPKRA